MRAFTGFGLNGSLGILIKTKRAGFPVDLAEDIQNMRHKGIWISKALELQVIKESAKQ